MTLILAWKDKKNIFVTGDAAVTRKGVSQEFIEKIKKEGHLTTTFGESTYIKDDIVVQESILKIHNIRNKFIIGYAGTGDIAIDVINDIEKDEELTKNNLPQKIKQAAEVFGNDFQMVIGYFDKKNPVLLSYNLSSSGIIRYHSKNNPVLLGNLRNEPSINIYTRDVIFFLKENEHKIPQADRKLLMVNTFMQNIIIRANLIERSVGGFFVGGLISRKGFCWQKDTAIIYFKTLKGIKRGEISPRDFWGSAQLMAILIRENKVAILSFERNNNYKDIAVFQNYINSSEIKRNYSHYEQKFLLWKIKYEKDITSILLKFRFKFFAFLCTDIGTSGKMTFLSEKAILQKKYFEMSWDKDFPSIITDIDFIKDVNPLSANFLVEFLWMPDK